MDTQSLSVSQTQTTNKGVIEQDQQTTIQVQSDRQHNTLAIVVSLISLYFLWGATYLGMRIALQSFPPFLLAGIRFIISGVLMLAFLRLRGAAWPTRKEWLGAALIGTLLLVGGNGGVTFAEKWVPSGLTAVATGAVPLWAALIAGFLGRWPSRVEWYGLALGFAGLVLLNVGHGLSADISPGTIVLLFSPIAWALGSILTTRVTLPKGFMATAAEMLCGGIILLVIGLGSGERITHAPTPAALWAMFYLVAGGALVAYTAYHYLLTHVRPALATSYAYVNPLVAVGLGIWLAGEQVTLMDVISMLIVLSGVVLVTVTRGRKS